MLYVGVHNIGPVPAVKVRVAFDPPFKGLGGNASIPELALFRNLEFLAPSRSIRTLLDSSAAYFARKEPEHITATVCYSDRSGEKFSSAMRHDLSIYRDIAFIPKSERTSTNDVVLRDVPYGNQHFRVDLGDGADGPAAGFSHVVMPDISIDVVQYGTGNDKESGTHQLPGLTHYGNVILRRGITGSLNLYAWINQVRNGD